MSVQTIRVANQGLDEKHADMVRDFTLRSVLRLNELHIWGDVIMTAAEDFEWDLRYLSTAIEEARRVLQAPDDEPMTGALYDEACDALKLDPHELEIPDGPGWVDKGPYLDDVVWSAGRYRALFPTLTDDVEGLLRQTINRSAWRIRFVEALQARLQDDPAPPPGFDTALPVSLRLPAPEGSTAPSAENLLTLEEAAERLRVHPKTVRRHVHAGDLKGSLLGGRWRFKPADLDRFLGGK